MVLMHKEISWYKTRYHACKGINVQVFIPETLMVLFHLQRITCNLSLSTTVVTKWTFCQEKKK